MNTKKDIQNELKKYPYLIKIAEYTIFEEKDDFEEIKNSKMIIVDNNNISETFLKRIILMKKYYSYAKKYFEKEINKFNISYLHNGDIVETIKYTKSQIATRKIIKLYVLNLI